MHARAFLRWGQRAAVPPPGPALAAAQVEQPVPEDKPRRILLVDDEQDVRESTTLLLEAMGNEVISTADPGDVLPLAMEHQPGLILQDLKMPGINLAGIVAALRSEPSTMHIPLIFFSANADVAETARRYDAWGFLRKPFGAQALAQAVDQAFGGGPEVQDPRRELRGAFHEQWNIISALTNYAHMMHLHAPDKATMTMAQKLEGQILRLEASMDRLHTYVSNAVETAPPAPRQAVSPGDLRPPRPARPEGGIKSFQGRDAPANRA